MNNGWIKLHRKIREKAYYKNSKYIHLWLHILLRANHKVNEFMWNNEIIIIKEGQFITGRKELSIETGINESTIEKILNLFEKEHQIEQQKTTKFRLITVINWKDYQEKEQQSNNRVTTKEQQSNTNNNYKNIKNEKKELSIDSVPSKTLKEYRNLRRKQIGKYPTQARPATEKQKAFLKRSKSLDYFHAKGIENGFDYLEEEDEQANKKFIGISRAYEKRYGDNYKEPIDWWFSGDNAWCDYHPSNFFSVGTWMKFDNKKTIRQGSWDKEKINSKKQGAWN